MQKRLRTMSQQVLNAQAQLVRKDEQIREEKDARKQLERRVEELNQQLENNSGMFVFMYQCMWKLMVGL